MRTRCLIVFTILAGLTAGAQTDLEKLRADAAKAHGGQQAKLYALIAEKLVDVADQQFTAGKSVEGLATVQDVLQHATKAHDIALNAHDDLKHVEISLRQTQRHLENLKRTLAAEDRPELDHVEKKLEQLRQDLLDAMFAPKKKENK